MTEQKFPTSQVPGVQNPAKPQTREEATTPDTHRDPAPAPETPRKRQHLASEDHLGLGSQERMG